jgi:hypothetical protein
LSRYKIIPFVDVTTKNPNKHTQMDSSFVAPAHQWTYINRNMSFDKDLKLSGKYCYHPFNTITVDSEGDIYLCICQAWLPISIGKIWDFHSFESIINSPKALEIQASIIDGSYRYCDHNSCSIIKENELQNKTDQKFATVNWINFAVDNSCNLTCPSCRVDFTFVSEGKEFEKRIKIVNHLTYLIEQHYYFLKFSLSGDGDPFASIIYRHFLSNLKISEEKAYIPGENQQQIEIELITNGILLKSYWHKLKNIHKSLVRTKISFDAGTEKVYNITRRGGDWSKLLDSVRFLTYWKKSNNSVMALTANFVVQTANYKDMPAYVELCDSLGFDEINFQKILDWNTFDNFDAQSVWSTNHPNYNDFLKILEHPSLNNKKINFTNLK